jgi:hypothetical protein
MSAQIFSDSTRSLNMYSLELNPKQLTYIILALDAYVNTLEQDEDDPGPSMADALYVSNLAKILRQKHEEGTETDA